MTRRDTGILGEKLGRDFLKKRGYEIIETNYRCQYGEIDIIARDKDCLAFIEVRAKKSFEFGIPEESITVAKTRKLRTAAETYRQTHGNLPETWRIDVLAIELGQDNKPKRVELLQNAVGEE